MNTKIGAIPTHQFIYVDSNFTHTDPRGWVEAWWTSITAIPGRAWGINVILREGGAMYRNLPPHAIAFDAFNYTPPKWGIKKAQLWDCYSYYFTTLENPHIKGFPIRAKIDGTIYLGEYLFNVTHLLDGWSNAPEQDKDFYFIKLDNGRLTIQPTNRITFVDPAFIVGTQPPKLKLSEKVFSCEDVL
jgi:hypothetical protein